MEDIYHKVINFSSEHSDVKERFNLLNNLLLKQIIEFSGVTEDKEYFIKIVSDLNDKIKVEVDEVKLNTDTNIQKKEFDEADIEIVITYDLSKTVEINVIEEKNVNEIFRAVINKITLKDVKNIDNEIFIGLVNEEKKDSLRLKTNWAAYSRDNYYLGKNLLVIPDFMPEVMQEQFSKEIFDAFIDLIAERKIGNEYLISLTDNKALDLSQEVLSDKSNNIYVYSIIKYVFDDEYRYDDKLKILRIILSKSLSGTELRNINWDMILQTLKSNYSLFINDKMENFIRLKTTLTKQVSELKQEIDKSIEGKVDEFSKQILIIVATIFSSFIIKMGNANNQFILIASAIIYVVLILIFNITKGITFSSQGFKKSKEDINDIEKNLRELEYSDDNNILNDSSSDINSSIEKLKHIEKLQFGILIFVAIGLIAMFIIA